MQLRNYTVCLLLCVLLLGCKAPAAVIDYQSIKHKVDLDRFEQAIVAFEEEDKTARYSSDLILFTGSSSIRFWKTLAEDMAPHPVLNRGFGGSILPEMNHYFERIVKKYQPKIIFLYCGENDIAIDYSPEETYSAYRQFISLCKAELPNTKIVFISMKPSPSRWDKWTNADRTNKMIDAYSKTQGQLYYIDVGPTMMQGTEPDKSIFVSDMLHMNPEGYKRWTKLIKPVLDDLNK